MGAIASRLLSHLSHELRAPLGVVRGYLRLLEQGSAKPEERQRRAIACAMDATEKALLLLDEAKALSRWLNGDVALNRALMPLASLLRVSAQAVELPDEPAITLEVRPTPNLAVFVDETRMRAALAAIVSSVVRAQARPLTIQVTAARLRIRHKLVARVIIAPQTLSGLKAREVPFDWARGGQGLQLAIASATIEAHDGHVRDRRLGDREAGVAVRLPLQG